MAEAPTRRRVDAYDHHPFQDNCGYSNDCQSIFTCPFDECPAEGRARAHNRSILTEKVAALRQQGTEVDSIAQQLGISKRSVFRYLNHAKTQLPVQESVVRA